jgi:radical SAM superfamily enzyme YgiQ (UPF0313 family)
MTSTLTDTLHASRSLVLAVKQSGVVVPRCQDDLDIVLDLAGVSLVQQLARGASSRAELVASVANELGVATDDLDALLDQLDARRYLVHGDHATYDEPVLVLVDEPVPTPSGQEVWVLPSPVVFRVAPEGFEYVDHEGRLRARLDPRELLAASRFCLPASRDLAFVNQTTDLGDDALDDEAFDDLVGRLLGAGLLAPYDPDDPIHASRTRGTEEMRVAMLRQAAVHQAFDRLEEEHDARPAPPDRVKVVGVHTSWSGAPASLGMLIAYAKSIDGGVLEESYDFRPRLVFDEARLTKVAADPGIFLFSNYIWCHEQNIALSTLVKKINPHSITIHGGPNTPKYEADVEQFFADNPHVDITVRGEGEATFADLLLALRGSVGDGPPDLSVLGDVPGLSFRLGDRVIQTADRDRIADLDTIPSPVLTGLFDGFIPAESNGAVVLETNRGCPYGCTFCDWGSATLSRIRKFDLDRVFAELEWCAQHQMLTVGIADANFGIFERDVQIAEKIAELKATYGYPRFVGNNYAKNTVKHLSQIIEIFTDAGIVCEGKMSMQSLDPGTLTTIRRKNIKIEKYNELSGEFRKNRLPMSVDLMMGLPGSTPATLRNDMQECIGRDVRVILHPTMLLPNSPMNDPDYRAEHGIVAKPGEYVRETATFTRDEWDAMYRLTEAFYLVENFGVLRHVAKYVHSETGMREVDFYEKFVEDSFDDPERWPLAFVSFQALPHLMVPPVSWRLFVDEVRRYLVEVVGIEDDSALDTVMAVQHALLPARDRTFPVEVSLSHDFEAWHQAVLEARDVGDRHGWHQRIPPLREFGPGTLRIDDPYGVCTTSVGGSLVSLSVESSWDFESPVSRPRQRDPQTEPDPVAG